MHENIKDEEWQLLYMEVTPLKTTTVYDTEGQLKTKTVIDFFDKNGKLTYTDTIITEKAP